MDQQVVEYLRTNKEKYTQESLVAQLRSAGHSEGDIMAALAIVYDLAEQSTNKTEQQIKYAGFWIRWVAAFIDGFLVGVVSMLVGFAIGFGMAATAGVENTGFFEDSFVTIISFGFTWAYYIIMTHKYRATFGKKLVGIEVRADDAENSATLGKIILRETIGKLLSMFTLYIGYMMAGFTQRKQALHDMIAGTVVVYKNPTQKKE